jgi:hypothetical protein
MSRRGILKAMGVFGLGILGMLVGVFAPHVSHAASNTIVGTFPLGNAQVRLEISNVPVYLFGTDEDGRVFRV